jgi:hypothetical protein
MQESSSIPPTSTFPAQPIVPEMGPRAKFLMEKCEEAKTRIINSALPILNQPHSSVWFQSYCITDANQKKVAALDGRVKILQNNILYDVIFTSTVKDKLPLLMSQITPKNVGPFFKELSLPIIENLVKQLNADPTLLDEATAGGYFNLHVQQALGLI